eukprot:PITA_21902
MDCKICDQVVSILIDLGYNNRYISPDLVDKCGLRKEVHEESWLVQLATSAKKRVHHWVRACSFELNVDCFDKAIECVEDSGEKRTLHGKKKPTLVRIVTAMQDKCIRRKGCMMFVVHISSDKGKEVEDADVLRRYQVLQQFQDLFPKEITEFLPHREVEFSIELVPEASLTLKSPYRMSTLELVELKL